MLDTRFSAIAIIMILTTLIFLNQIPNYAYLKMKMKLKT